MTSPIDIQVGIMLDGHIQIGYACRKIAQGRVA